MGRRSDDAEFPLLKALSLVACSIRGDGNCLFNALSDQLFGHQNNHFEIRETVINYMRNNRNEFIHFVVVDGTRRNPKRKTTTASSTSSFSFSAATDDEQSRAYEDHLKTMARGGTYGDNLEIIAFSKAYDTDVKIFNSSGAYYVRAVDDNGAEQRPVAYIAYHVWEHYSSVRNVDGPFTGLPRVHEKALSSEELSKVQAEGLKKQAVQEWMVRSVMTSLPYVTDEDLVRRTLDECHGHVDNAVSKLLDAEYFNGSLPSSPGSSGVGRDLDSDDNEIWEPNKTQNRRIKSLKRTKGNEATKDLSIPTFEFTQPDTNVTPLGFNPTSLPALTSLPPPTELPKRSADQRRARKVKKLDVDTEWADPSDTDYQHDGDDDDAESVYTSSSRAPSLSRGFTPPRTKIISNTKSKAKQNGPKRVTARDRKEAKKAAQKQARKTTKRANAGILTPPSSDIQRNSPPMESVIGMKTLYI